MIKDKYKDAMELALNVARRAQNTNEEESLKRQKIRSFIQTNPDTQVYVLHREIISGTDAATQYLDSGVTNDKELIKAITKLSKGDKLTADEIALVDKHAKTSKRLRDALDMYGKGITKRSTQKMCISESVLEWSVSKSMKIGGGVLTLRCMVDKDNILRDVGLGDHFYVYIENELIFWGVCGEVSYPDEWNIEYSVNDPMWYLRNGLCWIQNKPMTLKDAFVKICNDLALDYEPITIPDKYFPPLNPRVEVNTTAMSLLQTMIEETMISVNKMFYIRTSPDKLELVDTEGVWEDGKLKQEGSQFDVVDAMTSFKATQSIQTDTYNDISLYTKKGNMAVPWIEQDVTFVERYGLLRYQEVINNAIIKEETLDNIIRTTKYPTHELEFDIQGIINVMPGDTIRMCESIYLISDLRCTYDSSGYNMSITCARWQKPTAEGDPCGESWDFVGQMERERQKTMKVEED